MELLLILRYKLNQVQGILLSSTFFSLILFGFSKILSHLPQFKQEVEAAKSSVGLLFVNKQMWRLQEFIEFANKSDKISNLVLIPVTFNYESKKRKISEDFSSVGQMTTRKLSLWSLRDIVWAHNLKALVFSHPYVFWHTSFSIKSIKSTKTIYVPYTYGVLEQGPETHFGKASISASSVVLCETEKHVNALAGRFPGQILIKSGFPGNGLHHYSERVDPSKTVLKILVSPHWTSVNSEASYFESQIDVFLNELLAFQRLHVKSKLPIQYVWRPHPWFNSFAGKLKESARVLELCELVSNEKLGNKSSSNSVLEDFKSCDLLVHNSVSFIADWAFTGKQSLYWLPGSQFIDKLSEVGRFLLTFAETVSDAAALSSALEEALINSTSTPKTRQLVGQDWLNANSDLLFNDILLKQIETS